MLIILLLLTLNCFALAREAQAYVFLGPGKPRLQPADGRNHTFFLTPDAPRFVDKATFEDAFYAERSDDEVFSLLVERSMAVWNEVPDLGIQLHVAAARNGVINADDNIFSIGVGKINTVASGLAFPTTDENDDSLLRDCDIQVGQDIVSIPSFIYIMIHELGHCLGLGHNHSDPSAIMGYWPPRGIIKLGLDDMAGVLSLYPPNAREKTNSFAPCGVVAGWQEKSVDGIALPRNLFQRQRSTQQSRLQMVLLVLPLAAGLGIYFLRPWSSRRRQRESVP